VFVCGCLHPLKSDIQTVPVHAVVLLLGVPLLLAVLNFMWFIKIAKGAYKLVFKKQQQQQQQAAAASSEAAGAAAGKGGKQHEATEVVSIQAYSTGAALKAEHFE